LKAISSLVASILLLIVATPFLVYLVDTARMQVHGVESSRSTGNYGVLYLVKDNGGYALFIYVYKAPGTIYVFDSVGTMINDVSSKCDFNNTRTCRYPGAPALTPPVYMYVDGVVVEGVVVSS